MPSSPAGALPRRRPARAARRPAQAAGPTASTIFRRSPSGSSASETAGAPPGAARVNVSCAFVTSTTAVVETEVAEKTRRTSGKR